MKVKVVNQEVFIKAINSKKPQKSHLNTSEEKSIIQNVSFYYSQFKYLKIRQIGKALVQIEKYHMQNF